MFRGFYEKVFKRVIREKLVKGHDRFWDLCFDFWEVLTPFKYVSFYKIIKFTYVDNDPKVHLPVYFIKFLTLKKLAEGNFR